MVARSADKDDYDTVLGPSIGYVRGEGAVFSGTLLGRDGTPVAPGGVTSWRRPTAASRSPSS